MKDICNNCGHFMTQVLCEEKERIINGTHIKYTGRTRTVCSHLLCENCGNTQIVDETYDEPSYKYKGGL